MPKDNIPIFAEALEKEFNLKINEEDAEKLTTVGALIDYISQRHLG